ncbi:MAG: peptide deformylase [Minisyncoccales bacterium]
MNNENLKIIKYPDPLLRKKSAEVKEVTVEIKDLSQQMKRIMVQNQGVGLAAPQVGILKRIIVAQTSKGLQAMINPIILKCSQKMEVREEGCLSFPKLFLKIKRPCEIELEFLNLKGEKKKTKAQGWEARIFQHEIDHLNGILFIDRVPFWRRWLIKYQLKFSK